VADGGRYPDHHPTSPTLAPPRAAVDEPTCGAWIYRPRFVDTGIPPTATEDPPAQSGRPPATPSHPTLPLSVGGALNSKCWVAGSGGGGTCCASAPQRLPRNTLFGNHTRATLRPLRLCWLSGAGGCGVPAASGPRGPDQIRFRSVLAGRGVKERFWAPRGWCRPRVCTHLVLWRGRSLHAGTCTGVHTITHACCWRDSVPTLRCWRKVTCGYGRGCGLLRTHTRVASRGGCGI